jgi:hypothetical protein
MVYTRASAGSFPRLVSEFNQKNYALEENVSSARPLIARLNCRLESLTEGDHQPPLRSESQTLFLPEMYQLKPVTLSHAGSAVGYPIVNARLRERIRHIRAPAPDLEADPGLRRHEFPWLAGAAGGTHRSG